MTTSPLPLYYTFGNHMHWVDMEWLWGYQVLPDSTRDMLRFCAETGAKGHVNFDAVGYEKMAAEAPEALAELREAVSRGQVEVAGASYGQPYGLFHGGESNVRQRVYGARTVRRLLGVWPRTYWEEEFDFFPQLPQILHSAGFRYACLFYQWTWHTPHLPRETAPAIWWEGLDGTRLLTAPRSDLNLHQWPEDFAGLLESPALRAAPDPCLIQWLELMPSPDWMCRAELMLPQLRALMSNPDFELRFVTLPEYLERVQERAVTRRYTLDHVFHGMSLGKNGDLFRRLSRQGEQNLLAAEALSALSGYFGRPYPSWDVYPAWELEEAWRELLAAQHHDNDECEGLCGHVGRRSYERSLGLSQHVIARTLQCVADRTAGPAGRVVVFNPLGWTRSAVVEVAGQARRVEAVPPFGYRVLDADEAGQAPAAITIEETAQAITLRRGALTVTIDRARGVITQLASAEQPEGWLREDTSLADLRMVRDGAVERFERAEVQRSGTEHNPAIAVTRHSREGGAVGITITLAPEVDAIDLHYQASALPRPDPRFHAALQTAIALNGPVQRLIHDHPYGVSEVRAEGTYLRKYPTGDWMTSPQVFEEVRQPFTALQLLDFDLGERGLLVLHDGSQAFWREGDRVWNILSMYDAWDEDYFVAQLDARVRLLPHGPLTHAERWRQAQNFTRPVLVQASEQTGGELPPAFSGAWVEGEGVAATAFYREPEGLGTDRPDYAGASMGHPYIVRLVELNGQPASVRLRLPGPVAAAYRASLLGAALERLSVVPAEPPIPGIEAWSEAALSLRPHEIATLYLDPALGRKRSRNLDEYRHVWATVHRVETDQR